MSDEGRQLVAELIAGDDRAFRSLYEQHGDGVCSFALRLTGSRDAADEIYQHAWVKLAQSARRLAPDTNVLAWLLRVARNHWHSGHRRERTRERHRETLTSQADPSWGARDFRPDTSAEQRRRLERLDRALGELSEQHREVLLVMIEADDLPQHELAATLSLEPAVFRKRLSRARKALAELMRD